MEENEISSPKETELKDNNKIDKEKEFSKWINLKILLQKKKSLESSVDFITKKTLGKFLSNYCEIYKYKIEMYLFSKETNKFFLGEGCCPGVSKKIEISDDSKEICYDSCLSDFLFYFRENNSELLKLIDLIPEDNIIDFSFFLSNLFYGNFINPIDAQNELILIIFLLLEKSINELVTPTEDNFLNNRFLDCFFNAFLHREEIKKYINMVLISEIENINEKCNTYNSMDIIQLSRIHYKEYTKYINNYSFFNMEKQRFYVNETFNCIKNERHASSLQDFVVIDKPQIDDNLDITNQDLLNKTRVINYENISINSILIYEFFNEINIKDIQKLLIKEKDEFMRCFYIKQLKLSKNNIHSINCKDYFYEKMIKERLLSRNSIEKYNKGYQLIIQSLNGFLTKLENKVIIPFSLKIICRLIYILLKRKFPKITEFQLYTFIGTFLFDKFLNPIFENIESIIINEIDMISFDTKKFLLDIAFVFRQLIKGELFTNKQFGYYNIFNQYFLNNYFRIRNIIKNFIDVRIPKKISLLIEQFNNVTIKNNPKEINYNYSRKNQLDVVFQKCICFNVSQLLLIYNTVNNNKNIFIQEGTKFESIFNELSKYIPQMEINNNKYYVIVKEEINKNVKILFEEEKNKSFKRSDILNKLKQLIITLLSELKIRNDWNYFPRLNTKQTFDFINNYLKQIEKKKKLIPLNWYSKYIVEYLELIEENYKKDDYNLLFKSIIEDVTIIIKKLRNLNSFLCTYINNKNLYLNKKKNKLKKNFEGIKTIILKIKAILFLEKEKIDLCFMDGKKYNEIQKLLNKNQESKINKDILVISEISNCPHIKLKEEKYEKLCSNDEINQYHLQNVKDFANKFSSYNKIISEEIINHSINQSAENQFFNLSTTKNEINKNILLIESSKEILNTFINYINKKIETSEILTVFQKKEERELISKYILDFILKLLCIKIYEQKPLPLDNIFHQKCSILNSFVIPSQFNLPKEFEEKNILKDIVYYFSKIEEHRTPSAVYKEIGNAINLIYSMFKLFLNKTEVDLDDILNVIIYCLILTKSKRMIFNIYFCKFFLMEGEVNGNLSFNISQIESAINIINKINAQYLKLSDEEFNEKCSKFKFISN